MSYASRRVQVAGCPPDETIERVPERVALLPFWAWLVVAVACALYELLGRADLFALPFALGALAAAVATLLGASAGWQWGLFFAVSLLGIVGFRRWRAQGR